MNVSIDIKNSSIVRYTLLALSYSSDTIDAIKKS